MANSDPFKTYLDSLQETFKAGNATEHSYRGHLQTLLEKLVPEKSGISVINEPKRITDCGNPDYLIAKGKIPIGYIEAKDLGKDLNDKQYKEQFDRYKKGLDNLIITDYVRFQFFENIEGENKKIADIQIARIEGQKLIPLPKNFEQFKDQFETFCRFQGQTITSPELLAEMMANKARLLQSILENALTQDAENKNENALQDQFKEFKKRLIPDLTPKTFSDIYAQTLAYGLFAARSQDQSTDGFSRKEAQELIPKSNPFLRKLFNYIAGIDIDDRIKPTVENLADIFKQVDLQKLLRGFGKETQTEDPIIHFYETFLGKYDPKLRKSRGVWYTPKPVVNFIVRAVDDVLKDEFGLPAGLADRSKIPHKEKEFHKVQILDPATGTGTFLAETIKKIHTTFKGQQGIWKKYVDEDLIPRLNGFELLMASYTMAHMQLDLLLKEKTGYDTNKRKARFKIYLTNSLEADQKTAQGLSFASWLSDEANEANRVKRDTPVMCIIGNPPYSVESANKGAWIMDLMDSYKKEPGGTEKLKEKNPKSINDDYVKFLRYGQHFIEKNGSGVLAFINPHGFLDNLTFRGMRWSLLRAYDKIYTIDLHGNSKKKETAPDGSADQNIFDIMQGVSINVFVKTGAKKPAALGKVFHCDLYGKRNAKYEFLREKSLKNIDWKEMPNQAPMYFMVPKNFKGEREYDQGFSVKDLFPLNSVGVVTARDKLSIKKSESSIQQTIKDFLRSDAETARKKFDLGEDTRDWKVYLAQKDLEAHYPKENLFTKISYRPFDDRWTYYTGKTKGFHSMPRQNVMRHFLEGENVGLVYRRQQPSRLYVFLSKHVMSDGYIRSDNKGGESIAPLYRYITEDDDTSDYKKGDRKPNLDEKIVAQIAQKLGLEFVPEKQGTRSAFAPIDLLDYIYAVLHAPSYREKYQEFLKIDFPKVPYPQDQTRFWNLVRLGSELRRMHLMEHPDCENLITEYPEEGTHKITKKITKNDPGFVLTDEENKTGKVWINDTQYFDEVPQAVWEFFIGGYQPAQKWLKDRKGKSLSYNDISHYQKIIAVLWKTIRLMKEIDAVENITITS